MKFLAGFKLFLALFLLETVTAQSWANPKKECQCSHKEMQLPYLDDIYENEYFLNFEAGLLKPFADRFTYPVDLGLGVTLGIGRFVDWNHAFSVGMEYDVHSAFFAKYQYWFHFDKPYLSFGPSLGIRQKVFNLLPWDNYINESEKLPSQYLQLGIDVMFPMMRNSLLVGVEYLASQKPFLKMSLGFHIGL